MSKIAAALIAALAVSFGAGTAHADPVDPVQVCKVYDDSGPLADSYGISRREATIQFIAGWYGISEDAAEKAWVGADCFHLMSS